MDKQVAGRLAEQRLTEWRQASSYADLVTADLTNSTNDREVVGEDGVAYRVQTTLWREQNDPAFTLFVKVVPAQRRSLFRSSVVRSGRMFPDGTFVPDL